MIRAIRLRRDLSTNWLTKNPVLKLGEPGFEIDTYNLKIGNGTDSWNDLEYVSGNGVGTGSVLPHLSLTNNPFIRLPVSLDNAVSFSRTADGNQEDIIDTGVVLARGSQGALYNSDAQTEYNNSTHITTGIEWNNSGWGDLLDVRTRSYTTLRAALNNGIGENIIGAELVMHDTINDKYYKFEFTDWGQNNGGSFAYNRYLISDPNFFVKNDYGDEIGILSPNNPVGTGVGITRGNNQGIYNPYQENGWNNSVSPAGTVWNIDGWDNIADIETRTYTNFYDAVNGNLGNNVVGIPFIMKVLSSNKYYAIQFLSWTPNNNGGGFSYIKYDINLDQLQEGISFSDGTILKSATGIGRVKSTASGNRRIEEVHGSKTISVTQRVTSNYTGISNRTTNNNYEIFVARTPVLDEILSPIYNNDNNNRIQISFNDIVYRDVYIGSLQETEYWFYYQNNNQYVPQTEGNTVYIRIISGAEPVVWWNKNDLPGGSGNFRGAIIDYHAYSGEGTIIGTIHIVDDSGEEHISHTEVASGSTDSENDYLWLVQNEGTISYYRIDGESKTLKVHWSAKVFYGSEYYD